MLHLPFV